jgi:hypothetical protein
MLNRRASDMSEKIANILKYILASYPNKAELSASRLTKMLYLADWKSAIDKGELLTNSAWYYNHYGPYVNDFIVLAEKDPDIEVVEDVNLFGGKKRVLRLKEGYKPSVRLDEDAKILVDFVISATKSKSYQDFIHLVYSTYPVITSDKYTEIDLVELAKEYNEIKLRKKVESQEH